jgi:NTP pyrophosphatase (non-canonical NTP hydrolase)
MSFNNSRKSQSEGWTTVDFRKFQIEVADWSRRNFERQEPSDCFEGIVEEVGELAHARLKARQGIRGTPAEHLAAEKDAIGDILIYMADYCQRRGFDLAEIAEQTWDQVKRRDWTKNRQDGTTVPGWTDPDHEG